VGEQEVVQQEAVPDGQKAEEMGDVGPGKVPQTSRKAWSEGVLALKDGLLFRKDMLWVPEDENIIRQVLEAEYDTKVAGHLEQDMTIELIRRNFWWPKIDEQIIDFVRSCVSCQ
jgi:hypothetical protein